MSDRLEWIERRAVNEHDLLPSDEPDSSDLGQFGHLGENLRSQLFADLQQAVETFALEIAAWAQLLGLERGQRAVADTLYAQRAELRKSAPSFERGRTRKTDVPGHQDALVAPPLGGSQHRRERRSVSVDVR